MSNSSKYMIFGSMGAAGLVAVAALLDMFTGIPFKKQIFMDIAFVIGSAIVIYMGWDAFQESK